MPKYKLSILIRYPNLLYLSIFFHICNAYFGKYGSSWRDRRVTRSQVCRHPGVCNPRGNTSLSGTSTLGLRRPPRCLMNDRRIDPCWFTTSRSVPMSDAMARTRRQTLCSAQNDGPNARNNCHSNAMVFTTRVAPNK